jgi:hypothetical protein
MIFDINLISLTLLFAYIDGNYYYNLNFYFRIF